MEAYGFRVREGDKAARLLGRLGTDARSSRRSRAAPTSSCARRRWRASDKDGEPRGHLSAEEALAAADGPILLTHRPVELPIPDGVPLATDGLTIEV